MSESFTIYVNDHDTGKRLDSFVVSKGNNIFSRSYISELIRSSDILVNGKTAKSGYRVKTGDMINGIIPELKPVPFDPELIELNILYEDEHIIVLNKQAGIVVHPAPGNYNGTLVNGLLYHCPDLKGIGGEIRPGIVHRLDKETSGVIVVAKDDHAHKNLSVQFKKREVKKTYLALVYGETQAESGDIDLPIGRHPVDRKKMSTISRKSRNAHTRWRVKERFKRATLLELDLLTGRTHQIRVHCKEMNHPVLGDSVYGRSIKKQINDKQLLDIIKQIQRQLLHAWKLTITHPVSNKVMNFTAEMPDDMGNTISALRNLN